MNSKAETAIDESDINDVFESVYSTVMSNIQKFLCCHNLCKITKIIRPSKKGLISIQDIEIMNVLNGA